ncbi:MAG TPA: diphthamide synthesis protein, partial [Methanomicrobiales archaeon]|nr:diphthamide synthesis protein [Methanomicrobiales archaeon]
MIDTSKLVARLQEEHAHRVMLQFPAGLKRKAFPIAMELRQAGFEVIVSGDPCYGACDLAKAPPELFDILVHFGHAPLGRGEEGVIYEFYPCDFDVDVVRSAVPLLREKRIGLVTTVQHVHLLERMAAILARQGIEAVIAGGGGRTPLAGQVLGCSFEAARKTAASEILFVGTGLFHPTGIQLATGARVIA